MLTGFLNIFKNIIERRKICKTVAMATKGSHHGALQNFQFFFTFVPVLFVYIFVQNNLYILKVLFLKEHLSFDMSVKFGKFLKNILENIEILSMAGIFFE